MESVLKDNAFNHSLLFAIGGLYLSLQAIDKCELFVQENVDGTYDEQNVLW